MPLTGMFHFANIGAEESRLELREEELLEKNIFLNFSRQGRRFNF